MPHPNDASTPTPGEQAAPYLRVTVDIGPGADTGGPATLLLGPFPTTADAEATAHAFTTQTAARDTSIEHARTLPDHHLHYPVDQYFLAARDTNLIAALKDLTVQAAAARASGDPDRYRNKPALARLELATRLRETLTGNLAAFNAARASATDPTEQADLDHRITTCRLTLDSNEQQIERARRDLVAQEAAATG